MIHELIVTSVPRGLQAGRSGFTTVLRTRGIHPLLAETLERASAYRHVFPHGDSRNPQIRSHSVVSGATGMVSILSRISDAGSDYSGRSNKLAHHVALDSRETAARAGSNPAAVLLALERSGGFQRQWSGEPREQPVAPQVPMVPSEPGACRAWARLAGDGGWAGLLVDRALAKQPTWIIAPQGLDLLELYAEALGLVNHPQRWSVTFTTFALSAGDGLWLGTVDGSPEAQAARAQSRVAVVDLVRRAPLTAASPFIEAARGMGTVPWQREVSRGPAALPAVPLTLPPGSVAADPIAGSPLSDAGRGMPALPPLLAPAGPLSLNGGPPPLAPAPPPGGPGAGHPTLPAGGAWDGPRQKSAGPLLAGVAILFLVVSCAIVFVLVNRSMPPGPDGPAVAQRRVPDAPAITTPKEPTTPQPPPEPSEVKPPTPPPGPTPEELAAEQKRLQEEAERREKEAQVAARKDAFRGLRDRLEKARRLPLKADVNLTNQLEQPITIGALGDAEVEVDLPALPKVALGPGDALWQLSCKGPKGGPWSIVATPADEADTPLEISRVEAKQGELVLTLAAMTAARDPLVWLAAREALTTVPLLLRLPGETSQEFETFVQLCVPKQRDPIVLQGLLTDKKWLPPPKAKKPGQVADFDPLPGTPWPCRVELRGSGGNDIRGEVIPDAPQPLAATPRPTPLRVTATWTWAGEKTAEKEPFMETTLVMQTREGAGTPLEIRLEKARVRSPWSGPERLGDLNKTKGDLPAETGLLPQRKDFERTPLEDTMTMGQLMSFHYIARKYVTSLASPKPSEFDKDPSERRELAELKELLRRQFEDSKDGGWYLHWVEMTGAPKPEAPNAPDPKKDRDGHDKWNAKNDKHKQYLKAEEAQVREYWQDLKKEIQRLSGVDVNEKNRASDSLKTLQKPLIICCLLFEMEPVLQEKRLAKRLLEAVGNGDVELSGRVWATPCGGGLYEVLIAEFGKPQDSADPAANAAPAAVADAPSDSPAAK